MVRAIAGRIVGWHAHQAFEKLDLTRKIGVDKAGHADPFFAKSWMKRVSAAIASPISASLANSAGLWLMPPLQRTNSIAIGQSFDITCASWPAPEGSRIGS